MKASEMAGRPVLGLDVGKQSHWACLLVAGEVRLSRPVANRERDLDALLSSVPEGTVVVVDQVRNIGALAVSRAMRAGLDVAYLDGLAAHRAAGMFAGDAKTDERDALVIARTAAGVPDALSDVAEPDGRLEAARLLASQRQHMVACATRDKNRLRSVLLESCPAFEAACDPSDPTWLALMERVGGPWQVLAASPASLGALTRGLDRAKVAAAREAAAGSTPPSRWRADAEGPEVRLLARRVREAREEAARLDAEIASLLADDPTYLALLTVPGVGPRTASELAIEVDVSRFPDHDHLASYCGLAPRNRSSGTSVRSVSASRGGNKRLKHLLVFSCGSLCRSDNRFGRYYRACRERGMSHGRAIKAVARKRLKVIYAVMRDRAPYEER